MRFWKYVLLRLPDVSLAGLIAFLLLANSGYAQKETAGPFYYSRLNTYGFFVAYSNDSSHMLLGIAEKRKLLNLGFTYGRRLLVNRFVNWQYSGEVMPVALESDPLTNILVQQITPTAATATYRNRPPQITCTPVTVPYSYSFPNGPTYSGTETYYCHGRQWTMGEGMSPIGFQWNFRPKRRLQPFVIGHGGYMYSTHAIPIEGAGAFNFTFDGGLGVEWYRSRSRSVRADYRYHHISNHGTSDLNPGIDNGMLQLTYSFGR